MNNNQVETCWAVRPGGTHVYSSNAHPLSPSDETVWAGCGVTSLCRSINTSHKNLHKETGDM